MITDAQLALGILLSVACVLVMQEWIVRNGETQ
jgi:hypothetical protein